MLAYLSQRGMVLIVILIFLEIFSMLGLYALQENLWESKLSQRLWHKHILESAAKAELYNAEKTLQQALPNCQISVTSAPILVSHKLDWWTRVSCAGIFQTFQYYYVYEFLGDDSCAYLEDFDESLASIAGYYRLTVLITTLQNPSQRIMLQSSIIRPVRQKMICKNRGHRVTAGRQMLRELI